MFSFLFSSVPGVGRSQGPGIAPQALQRHRPCANFAVLDFARMATQVSFFFIEEKRKKPLTQTVIPPSYFTKKQKQNRMKQNKKATSKNMKTMKNLTFHDYSYDQAVEAYQNEKYHLVDENKIGMFSATDYSGTGEFCWFDNLGALVDFFLNTWLPSLTRERDETYYTFMDHTRALLDLTVQTPEQIMGIANDNPLDDTQIKWIGTIDDLMTGESSFAMQVRDHFACNEGKSLDATVKNEFIAFLKGYFWA
jgi:hypothetical protein